jgi:hypothetical protein
LIIYRRSLSAVRNAAQAMHEETTQQRWEVDALEQSLAVPAPPVPAPPYQYLLRHAVLSLC